MAHDLFINAVIMITFITLGNQIIYRNFKTDSASPLKLQIASGVLNGIVGCVLMLYSVNVIPGVIVDFRNNAILLASVLGGPVSAIITSLMIGTFRILYYGLHSSSVTAAIIILFIGAGCALISVRKFSFIKKWIYTNLITAILGSIMFVILVSDKSILLRLLTIYWTGNILTAITLFYYLSYIITTNEMFHRYKEEAAIDFLTGLNNVRQFDKIYNAVSQKAIAKEEHLSLLFIDIDFFKKVNDTYGHSEGDLVLKELGQILSKTCRDFDIVSRNGGEEFSVLLLDCMPQQAVSIAERIRNTVDKHQFVLSDGKAIHITISIGIATYPDTTQDMGNLRDEADNALYKAKHTGRNKVVI